MGVSNRTNSNFINSLLRNLETHHFFIQDTRYSSTSSTPYSHHERLEWKFFKTNGDTIQCRIMTPFSLSEYYVNELN